MSYRAVVDIPRAPAAVWGVLTDTDMWTDWWGGAMSGVSPGWEVDGKVGWAGGGEARITALQPEKRLELVSTTEGTRWRFDFDEAPGGGTRFIFVEDFSESQVEVGDRDAKLARNEAKVVSFRDAVVSRTPAEPKWWQIWK